MALLENKIAEIPNPQLRQEIAAEFAELKKRTRFGLVFESHQPEVVPLYDMRIKAGERVARYADNLEDTWQVLSVRNGEASCIKDAAPDVQEFIPLNQLVAVRRMGEPIFPSLTPLNAVSNGDPASPHHILIEADNFHALQLLLFPYEGKIDCIYIDPPYNTGARDWKYNNNYIDENDTWRHSKWLTFIKKRLQISKRLLKDDGTLIIAIDDNEQAHLACLIEDIFPSFDKTTVTIVNNPRGNIKKNFAQTHEYAIFLTPKGKQTVSRITVDNTSPRKLRRWGHYSLRTERKSMFFPIYVKDGNITRIGTVPDDDFHPEARNIYNGEEIEIWPIDQDGVERRWNFGLDNITKHLNRIVILPKDGGLDLFLASELSPPKTVWVAPELDAGGIYGSTLVESIVKTKFPYPKSLYAVKYAIEPIVREKPNALVLDFFAGSGTTLNAVNLMNAVDSGQRQCILVTNNEVSEEEARTLTRKGLQPGKKEWEAQGICRSVTFPRSKYTMLGRL